MITMPARVPDAKAAIAPIAIEPSATGVVSLARKGSIRPEFAGREVHAIAIIAARGTVSTAMKQARMFDPPNQPSKIQRAIPDEIVVIASLLRSSLSWGSIAASVHRIATK